MNSNGPGTAQLTDMASSGFSAEYPFSSRDGRTIGFISNYNSFLSAYYKDAFIADLSSGYFHRITGDQRSTPATPSAYLTLRIIDDYNIVISANQIMASYKGCTNSYTPTYVSPGQYTITLNVPGGEDIWVKAVTGDGKGDLKAVRLSHESSETREMHLSDGTVSARSATLSPDASRLIASVSVDQWSPSGWSVNQSYRIWDISSRTPLGEFSSGYGGDAFPSYSPNGSLIACCMG